MSSHPLVETIEAHGCSIVLRRVEGPEAQELFFSCQPPAEAVDAGQQAEAIYQAVLGVLEAEGGSFSSVVSETLFLRNLRENVESVRAARQRILIAHEATTFRPAVTEIEQPPLNERACLEVLVQAALPSTSSSRCEQIEARPACGCAECARSRGLRVNIGEQVRFYAGGIYGGGEGAYEQTLAMFEAAEKLLQQAGMEFGDVMRTWIYFPEMERDYAGFNRARREFFESREIDPVPASTGIGAGLVPAEHDLCLGVYAVQGANPPVRTVMTTPTLNEAPVYGADFSRGMRILETNKVALHISGTASLDETGKTVHVGDFEAQADRMLVNVAALLEGQGATFGDVVSAVTYVKDPMNTESLRQKFHEAGFEGFPNVLVEARVCRPDLLCETEVQAVLPI
jgi:enamine deaminase RidA (YjgF/YER057c/UK114 family)